MRTCAPLTEGDDMVGTIVSHVAPGVVVCFIVWRIVVKLRWAWYKTRHKVRRFFGPPEFHARVSGHDTVTVTQRKIRGALPGSRTPKLEPMMISKQCSAGDCWKCPGNGCEHDCPTEGHGIVAKRMSNVIPESKPRSKTRRGPDEPPF